MRNCIHQRGLACVVYTHVLAHVIVDFTYTAKIYQCTASAAVRMAALAVVAYIAIVVAPAVSVLTVNVVI
jgi:hypothetical protein